MNVRSGRTVIRDGMGVPCEQDGRCDFLVDSAGNL